MKIILSAFLVLPGALGSAFASGNNCAYSYSIDEDVQVSVTRGGECLEDISGIPGIYSIRYSAAKYKTKGDCRNGYDELEKQFSKPKSDLTKKALQALAQHRQGAHEPIPSDLAPEGISYTGCFQFWQQKISMGAIIKDQTIPGSNEPLVHEKSQYLLVATLRYRRQAASVNNPDKQQKILKSLDATAKNIP